MGTQLTISTEFAVSLFITVLRNSVCRSLVSLISYDDQKISETLIFITPNKAENHQGNFFEPLDISNHFSSNTNEDLCEFSATVTSLLQECFPHHF